MANSLDLKANIGIDEILAQYDEVNSRNVSNKPKKVEYDKKHYLQAYLQKDELAKDLTIRLLPFSPEGGNPFHMIYVHPVKVSNEISKGGFQTYICPTKNGLGDRCPFCETMEKAKEMYYEETDDTKRKQISNIAFQNRPKEYWVVRCIDRDHEEDGVKFWMFPHSRKNDGIYDKIMNIAKKRAEQGKKRGKDINIFDLYNGKDLEITLSRDANNKTVFAIVDSDELTPLNEDFDIANSWIGNDIQWTDLWKAKPYDYLALILENKVPFYDKEKKCYVARVDYNQYKAQKEAAEMEAANQYEFEKPENVKEIEVGVGTFVQNEGDDDIPF